MLAPGNRPAQSHQQKTDAADAPSLTPIPSISLPKSNLSPFGFLCVLCALRVSVLVVDNVISEPAPPPTPWPSPAPHRRCARNSSPLSCLPFSHPSAPTPADKPRAR